MRVSRAPGPPMPCHPSSDTRVPASAPLNYATQGFQRLPPSTTSQQRPETKRRCGPALVRCAGWRQQPAAARRNPAAQRPLPPLPPQATQPLRLLPWEPPSGEGQLQRGRCVPGRLRRAPAGLTPRRASRLPGLQGPAGGGAAGGVAGLAQIPEIAEFEVGSAHLFIQASGSLAERSLSLGQRAACPVRMQQLAEQAATQFHYCAPINLHPPPSAPPRPPTRHPLSRCSLRRRA